jgi:hypothetical protein
MVRVPRVLIAGGYGVFGRLLAAELLQTTDAEVVIAGRDLAKARAACRDLDLRASGRVEPMRIDLARPGELREAAGGCIAVACTAGPFQALRTELVREVVEAGAHWVDIADASGWVLGVLQDSELDERARAAGVAVGTGLSTLPALSGVLARWLIERVPRARTATVILSIGNRNRKGSAAIASALMSGMRDPSRVDTPLGPRRSFRIDAPDEQLLASVGLEATCRVALESVIARRIAILARSRARERDSNEVMGRSRLLSRASSLWSYGASGGCVQVEVRDDRGLGAVAAFVGPDQAMAILPAAIAVERLVDGSARFDGVIRPTDWMPITDSIAELRRRGIRQVWRRIRPG